MNATFTPGKFLPSGSRISRNDLWSISISPRKTSHAGFSAAASSACAMCLNSPCTSPRSQIRRSLSVIMFGPQTRGDPWRMELPDVAGYVAQVVPSQSMQGRRIRAHAPRISFVVLFEPDKRQAVFCAHSGVFRTQHHKPAFAAVILALLPTDNATVGCLVCSCINQFRELAAQSRALGFAALRGRGKR